MIEIEVLGYETLTDGESRAEIRPP